MFNHVDVPIHLVHVVAQLRVPALLSEYRLTHTSDGRDIEDSWCGSGDADYSEQGAKWTGTTRFQKAGIVNDELSLGLRSGAEAPSRTLPGKACHEGLVRKARLCLH